MPEFQPGLFDMGPLDAEAASKQRLRQRNAEMDDLLLRHVGQKEYDRIKREDARLNAEYAKMMHGFQRRPDIQAAMDAMRVKIRASYKPFLANECALLGIDRAATKREIRNAYRRLARKLHPDVGGDEAAFTQLHAAYRRVLAAAKE